MKLLTKRDLLPVAQPKAQGVQRPRTTGRPVGRPRIDNFIKFHNWRVDSESYRTIEMLQARFGLRDESAAIRKALALARQFINHPLFAELERIAHHVPTTPATGSGATGSGASPPRNNVTPPTRRRRVRAQNTDRVDNK